MYGFKKPLTKENILYEITEWDIFKYYCINLVSPDTSFTSEFRKDSNPSCRVTDLGDGYRYKDFGEDGLINCFDYVARKYGLSFIESLEKVRKDFNLNMIESYEGLSIPKENAYRSVQPIQRVKKPVIIKIKRRPWNINDKNYWYNKYSISLKWLIKADICPISHFWIVKDNMEYKYKADKLAYAYNYYWNEDIFRRKIYQPFNSTLKWVSNVDNTIVQGWDLLPKSGGNILIMTSSYKDIGVLFTENLWAIAPNSEETYIPDKVFEKLKTRWDKIVIWYNNDFHKLDNPGLRASIRSSEYYNIPYITTPDWTSKDPSDYREKYGPIKFKLLVKNLLGDIL